MEKSKAIIVGGPVAVGKSTLVGGLPFNAVQELDPNDELQRITLQKMYEGDKIAAQIFQLDMILTRMDKYRKFSKEKIRSVYDRFIFEDYFFAEKLLSDNEHAWNYYKNIWNDLVDEIINKIGKPEIYIILTCSWENFKKRILLRNRPSEIEQFKNNPEQFKEIFMDYDLKLSKKLEKYDIDYLIINTDDVEPLELLEKVKIILAEKGIK
ncbi:MAG: deoxynucleoside kinase [Mycoplasma sp.]|nr:deoxynucleoside kinase [Mycoplasma sp.]